MDETASLADRRHWFDRAAPFASRLAAGVGSGIALPRADAVPVGPARLAEQTRTASAQPGRVLGRAVVAAATMGGRNDSGLALWRTNVSEKSRRHGDCRLHAGVGHRREHGDIQCGPFGAVAPIVLPGLRTAGGGLAKVHKTWMGDSAGVISQLRSHPRAIAGLRKRQRRLVWRVQFNG